MSAIMGAVGLDGRPWGVPDLAGMFGTLAPLGRDGRGAWAGTAGRCGVAIGAALRHGTPEDAADRQPVQSRDGSLLLVGDLRVDNRDEIAGTLGLTGSSPIPDSAFVLAGYERWGESVFDRVVGEFALAIVDRLRGGVLLARDAVGLRPLVIHERPAVVAFASTALALTEFEGVGHALDVRHAAEILALGYSSERTFVDGVRWVPPGTVAWIDGSGVRRRKWWDPDPDEIVDLGSPRAHELELREAFDRAVSVRLRSVGGVGAAVSGGLDSSSAAATAARMLAPDPLPTYTSVPPRGWSAGERPGWDADESQLVLALARMHPNLVPRFVQVSDARRLLDLQEPLWEMGAGPTQNPCNLIWIHEIRARAAAEGITTLLTGDRGNLFFSADGPYWLAAHLRAGRPVTAWREAATWKRSSDASWYRLLSREVAVNVLPLSLFGLVRRLAGRPGNLKRWLAGTGLRREAVSGLDLTTLLPQLDGRRGGARRTALAVLQSTGGQADVRAVLAARTGTEDRDPTADRRVLEVALRQPEWVRRRQGISRAAVRGAMADRLPDAIVHRARRGEQLPNWLDLMTSIRADVAREIDQLERHPVSRELIDVPRLRRLLERWPERSTRADPDVTTDYRLALLRSVLVGRYVGWFQRRASRGPSPGHPPDAAGPLPGPAVAGGPASVS